ncbi:uncharacterized protein LOC108204185 [Daucus carota subsp. sativus]|uniref:uncharacterized protein LOC108204185 n=1 Tax=Daucus carota subsp. sativus TaxID=79200 RepID=UPI0007F0175A|nr:PREDICTED: uncharacterized protein DDB_G0290685-like [Daucus carota subsp. sativus]XP_017228991.1 PREDICTED: uncharacterized protein DDB_G0290685-like [Daucus carota subsp. sativus]
MRVLSWCLLSKQRGVSIKVGTLRKEIENDQSGFGVFRDGDEFGSKLCENENRFGDRDWKGFINDEGKFEGRKSEKLGGVEGNERNEGAFKEIKEGDKDEGSNWSEIGNEGDDRDLRGIEDEMEIKEWDRDQEGIKWSDIGNEGGDRDLEGIKDEMTNPKNLSVVEGNEGALKGTKEGDEDKEGSKWSEIMNEDDDHDLEGIKDETEIKERNTEKRSDVEEDEGGREIKNEGSDRDLKGVKDEAKIK